LLYIITTKNTCIQFDCDYMFYNVCYDGKEYNGVLRESKRNAKIQIVQSIDGSISLSVSQAVPSLLLNPEVHCYVRKCPPLNPILNQLNPVQTVRTYFFNIHFILLYTPQSPKCSSLFRLLSGRKYTLIYGLRQKNVNWVKHFQISSVPSFMSKSVCHFWANFHTKYWKNFGRW
jgi:hypothetical protein